MRTIRVTNLHPPAGTPGRGRALVSYLAAPTLWNADSRGFLGHSNAWESAEVVRQVRVLGFETDVIDWYDSRFAAQTTYDLTFEIDGSLASRGIRGVRHLLHATGSHPSFSNSAERARLDQLRERRGVSLRARRAVSQAGVEGFDASADSADLITLIGNAVTLATYPRGLHSKIRLVTASGAMTRITPAADRRPKPREFLWFGGSGAVHKGLDLVLEVFARNPQLTLHVVGPYHQELDFVRAYRRELFGMSNIHSHGYLVPSSDRFLAIAGRCISFVSPSCSEGISTAVITCLTFGMIPIISRNCGIDLTADQGMILIDCSLGEIDAFVAQLAGWTSDAVAHAATSVQQLALRRYSRTEFSRHMHAALRQIVQPAADFVTSGATRHSSRIAAPRA